MTFLNNMKILMGKKPVVEPTVAPPPPKKTVLLVEDEAPLANVLAERLREESMQTIIATNGQIGLDFAAKYDPDLIVLDLLMPVMDGKEMLRNLRKIPACAVTPVIILSNAGSIENIRETQFFSDADEFLIKSNVSMEEIVEKIKDKLLATRIA